MFVLCVNGERDKQVAALLAKRELNFALTWIAFVFGPKQTWLEKWQLSHGFAVDGAYFLGFSTFLSEKCNCHTVSLWGVRSLRGRRGVFVRGPQCQWHKAECARKV